MRTVLVLGTSLLAVGTAVWIGLAPAQGRINQLYGSFNGGGAQQGSLYPPTAPMKAQAREIRATIDRVKREMAVVSRP